MKCSICNKNMKMVGEIRYQKFIGGENGTYHQKLEVCSECGFVTTINPISNKELDYLYKEGDDYTNYSNSFIEKDNYVARVNKTIGVLTSLELSFSSVLDVGASTGYLLNKLKEKNVSIYGVETSRAGCISASERYGINLFHGSLGDYVQSEFREKYDLVCVCHVLEHIGNLMQFMEDICQVSGKYVYVEVPALSERLQTEPYGFFAEEHINYFTPYTLALVFAKFGYGNIHMSIDYMSEYMVENGFPMLAAVFEKGKEHTLSKPVIDSELILKKYMQYSEYEMGRVADIINNFDNEKKLAIWGASFQLEKLLAYTKLGEKNITYIIDNSKQRQKLCVHIGEKCFRVVGFEMVKQHEVDKILITTRGSQEAIYRQIVEAGYKDKVILLYD